MNFSVLLEQEHSEIITSAIVDEVDLHPEKMEELMAIFLQQESPILSQRAG